MIDRSEISNYVDSLISQRKMAIEKEWIVGLYDPTDGSEITLLIRNASNKTEAKKMAKEWAEREYPGWIKKRGFSITAIPIDPTKPITVVHSVDGG